jgi:hypothetical protein
VHNRLGVIAQRRGLVECETHNQPCRNLYLSATGRATL